MSRALITGASAGLGAEFARQIAGLGHDVVLVARRWQRLQQLATQIRDEYGVQAQVCVADLAVEDDLARVAEIVGSATAPVSLLVNNAGFGLGQSFLGGALDREEAGLQVMVKAVMVLSHVAAHAMMRRGRGAIINVSSIASGTAMGTYAAHKTWVEQFSASLYEELRGSGVTLTCLKPGTTRTDFFATISADVDQLPTLALLDPAFVVRQALAAVARGRATCVPGVLYKAMDILDAKAPRAIVRRVANQIRRTRLKV